MSVWAGRLSPWIPPGARWGLEAGNPIRRAEQFTPSLGSFLEALNNQIRYVYPFLFGNLNDFPRNFHSNLLTPMKCLIEGLFAFYDIVITVSIKI